MNLIEISAQFTPFNNYLIIFILTITIIWTFLVTLSLKKDGLFKTLRLFFPMMLAALFIESSGVANGRFYYPGYLIYIATLGGGVPLIIAMGWSTNLFIFQKMSISALEPLYHTKNFIQITLLSVGTALIGISLDVLEDPLAHYLGWWIWTEETTTATLLDVPLSNYIDWMIILFIMSLITLWIEYTPFSEKRKVLLSFFSLPLVFAAILGLHTLFELLLSPLGIM